MKTTRLITTAVFSILLLTGIAWAGSIWAKAKSPKPLHADDTASRIGDILTIIIDERTTIDNKSERNLEKKFLPQDRRQDERAFDECNQHCYGRDVQTYQSGRGHERRQQVRRKGRLW
ncbi:MAG: flagellar basal body L-ring protein FlgH [Phycisphaerae bacterium]|nr:flagellar basal body L-ring protein FlgH [Phycisphaerae bacterium]